MPSPARPFDVETFADAVDPRLEELLRGAVLLGAVLVLLVPAARGHHEALGWLPLWLVGMPLVAWWALHRFRLPQRSLAARRAHPATVPVRRAPQARRRARPRRQPGISQAA